MKGTSKNSVCHPERSEGSPANSDFMGFFASLRMTMSALNRVFRGVLNKKRGFTLIEMVLTIVIISVGLFGMMVLFNNVTRGAVEGDLNIMASYLAREKLEQLVFDKVYKGYGYLVDSNYNTNENVSAGNNNFTRQLSIYEVAKADLITVSANSGFKRIDMIVKWGNSANQRITMSTLVSNY